MSLLTIVILFPLIGAIATALTPRTETALIRAAAAFSTFVSMVLSVVVFVLFEPGTGSYQFVQKTGWVESLGISFHVGVDGINVGLVLMSAIVAFSASLLSKDIKTREKEFYTLLLIMASGVLGAFASLDLFFFYFFHELALVPTFIMIGVWGRGKERGYAAFNITMYLSLGALIALAGLIGVYIQVGIQSFDMIEMQQAVLSNPIRSDVQKTLFPLLLFGFGILVSLWPFHSWAPLGYGAAPTATSMLHAGALKKFGLYGLIRIALPLLPEGAKLWMEILAWLCLGNILYCGLVAMRQKDLNQLIGNSSVAHMGFIFLGIASLSLIGITGAVMVMVAHGLLAALSFGLSGTLYKETQDLTLSRYGGILKQTPFLGSAFLMAMMAACGLPGFANFVGEALVFFGAWSSYPWQTVIACWGGLVIGGVYMLRAIRSLLHGESGEATLSIKDAHGVGERTPYALLLASLLVFGFVPGILVNKIKPEVELILSRFNEDGPVTRLAMETTSNVKHLSAVAEKGTLQAQ